MKHLSILLCICLLTLGASAQTGKKTAAQTEKADSSWLLKKYLAAIDTLVLERDSLDAQPRSSQPNPYFLLLLSRPTLYGSTLQQVMGTTDTSCPDPQVQRIYASRQALASLYAHAPRLVTQTEADLKGQALIRSDVNEMLTVSDKLADKVAAATLAPEMEGPIEVITRRPNFWKFSGDASLQFVQNYFSDNWYKGGETNFTGNFALTLRANYNDQRKFTWNNTLDFQLGFQTTESDKNRTFRPSSNLLRYTTDAGYKAWKNWYYSLLVILQTQVAPNYQRNSDNLSSKFLSPLEVTVAPGMKWEVTWGSKKQFSYKLNVAPLAMKILYVHEDDIVTNFGLAEGENSKITFGPNITMNTRWQICKQIVWSSRVYWMSNYTYNIWEWENTIDFTVTKLITAQMYLYPRFDNSSTRKYPDGAEMSHFMFKEWLSLGLKYNF